MFFLSVFITVSLNVLPRMHVEILYDYCALTVLQCALMQLDINALILAATTSQISPMLSHWLPKPPSLNLKVNQSSFMGVTWVRVETVGATNYVHKKSLWKLRIFVINIFWVESVEVCQCTDVFSKEGKDSEIIPSPFWICSQHLLNVSLCCMMTAGSWCVHVST